MLVLRILSRVTRNAGIRSSLSAVTLPARNQTPVFSSRFHSLAHDFSHKVRFSLKLITIHAEIAIQGFVRV